MSALVAGQTISHYRILRPLGAGGMGEVYRAEDTKLGRQVALKVLAHETSSDPDRRARFEREARAIAALNHPNIVTIYSVEEDNGVLFMTMELVDGTALAEIIPATGMSLDKLLKVATPLADAIGTAHHRGITHRDLKPANVMISDEGRVKVLDFGLAKQQAGAFHGEAALLPTEHVTAEGKILGTIAYMSPEQVEGKIIDQRSDIFSLGIVLFEMATGQRPFKATRTSRCCRRC
jgi:eukaryotic-like serine/threonine-protein kinase